MNKLKKTFKRIKIKDIDIYSFHGPLDSIISSLEHLKEIYPKYKNLQIDLFQEYDELTIELFGDREETDEEYNIRVKRFLKLEADKRKRADAKLQKAKFEQIKVNAKKQEIEDLMKKFNVKTLDELLEIKNYITTIDI